MTHFPLPDAHLVATVMDHRATREAWGVALLQVHRLTDGERPLDLEDGHRLIAVGDWLGLTAPGERLELAGDWERSDRFGLQLRVTQQTSLGIREPFYACKWLERLDGVGPHLAQALWAHFGVRLPAVLAGEEEADLTEVAGVGPERARSILESFQAVAGAGDLELLRYLDGLRASRYEIGKLRAWCAARGRDPREVLEQAPYDLLDVKGMGFVRVDRLARAAGCPREAPARLEAGLLHAMEGLCAEGSTMVARTGYQGLLREAGDLLGVEELALWHALERLARAGEVVVIKSNRRTWVHPADLIKAERVIYRCATRRSLPGGGSPGALPNQAGVPTNASECQDPDDARAGGPTSLSSPARAEGVLQESLAKLGPETMEDWDES